MCWVRECSSWAVKTAFSLSQIRICVVNHVKITELVHVSEIAFFRFIQSTLWFIVPMLLVITNSFGYHVLVGNNKLLHNKWFTASRGSHVSSGNCFVFKATESDILFEELVLDDVSFI